jgi:hypothetical protein
MYIYCRTMLINYKQALPAYHVYFYENAFVIIFYFNKKIFILFCNFIFFYCDCA